MNVLEVIQDWVPTFFTVLFVVACYWVVKYFMDEWIEMEILYEQVRTRTPVRHAQIRGTELQYLQRQRR